MHLPFEADAFDEFQSAAAWYERERKGYGLLFVPEVEQLMERAAQFPRSGSRAVELSPELDVRRFVSRPFPYTVVTAIVGGRRARVAVTHTSREPDYWRDRLT